MQDEAPAQTKHSAGESGVGWGKEESPWPDLPAWRPLRGVLVQWAQPCGCHYMCRKEWLVSVSPRKGELAEGGEGQG